MGAAPTAASASKTSNRPTQFRPSTPCQRHLVVAAHRCTLARCARPLRSLAHRGQPLLCWRRAGIWQRLFEAVQQQADADGQLDWAVHYVDGTIVRAHQHAAGSPKGAEAEALGRSQGGFSTKIHLRAAGDKHLMTFVLTSGQRHETVGFESLMAGGAVKRSGRGRPKQRPGRVVGDKACSSRHIRRYLRRRGIRITIPHKKNEHRSGPFDRAIYRLRERVERLINRLKQNRRIATRYEKGADNYRAMWLIAATLLWL
jgi:transposase